MREMFKLSMKLRAGNQFAINDNSTLFVAPIDIEPGDKIELNMSVPNGFSDRVIKIVRGRRIIYKRPDVVSMTMSVPAFDIEYGVEYGPMFIPYPER